jgi:putative membrane protein
MRPLAFLTAGVLAAAMTAAPAFAQLKSDQKIDNADAAAMKQLAQDNLNEIDAGKAAAAKAQSPQVKQFAQKMVDDHTQMLNDLKSLAQKKSVSLPDSVALKDKAEMKMMERASGADFDKKYMEQMVKDHQKDAKATQDLIGKAKDADFKAAVQKANAKINEHLQLAQRIAGSTAAGATSSSSTPSSSASSSGNSSNSQQQINPGISYSK